MELSCVLCQCQGTGQSLTSIVCYRKELLCTPPNLFFNVYNLKAHNLGHGFGSPVFKVLYRFHEGSHVSEPETHLLLWAASAPMVYGLTRPQL